MAQAPGVAPTGSVADNRFVRFAFFGGVIGDRIRAYAASSCSRALDNGVCFATELPVLGGGEATPLNPVKPSGSFRGERRGRPRTEARGLTLRVDRDFLERPRRDLRFLGTAPRLEFMVAEWPEIAQSASQTVIHAILM